MLFAIFCLLFTGVLTSSNLRYQPFADVSKKAGSSSSNALVVDLGYSVYEGVTDTFTGLNVWNGIRFAAPPTGQNRWQAPQVPEVNRSSVMPADAVGANCPQTYDSNGTPGANGAPGNEDCLFLDVYAPIDAINLPVLVWIHGGGYGGGFGWADFSSMLNANGNNFVAVGIQYRLGAFGFLSSEEVYEKGVPNAGLLDQIFALQWVQAYIKKFGGDPTRVTISGESAGAGSVMLLDMAYGGTLNTSLFVNSIAASPYLPTQYAYNAALPSYQYEQFAIQAGCYLAPSIFDCLLSRPTEFLQYASEYVTSETLYGHWAFLPVTDGTLIQDLPSRQLYARKLNGLHLLTGNNANEGSLFTPANITTVTALVKWLSITFPALSATDISSILTLYPDSSPASTQLYATDGTSLPSTIDQSSVAINQQQRADNIYAETTFVCPSYWLAEAYSPQRPIIYHISLPPHRHGYKYQYSVIPATHGQDVAAYFDAPTSLHSADFSLAFKQIWGNFVTTNNPSISSLIANGQSTGNESFNPISKWPVFDLATGYPMVDLNETFVGGVAVENVITVVDGWTWEGRRGERCEFWRSLGAKVPE